MVTIKKPKAITITIRDRTENKSESITVYGNDLDSVKDMIQKIFTKK